MALHVRFQHDTEHSLFYSIERQSDGLLFDWTSGTFLSPVATGAYQLLSPLPEDSSPFRGRYKVTQANTPAAQFTDGDYVVSIHDGGVGNQVVAELGATMHGGDDAPVFPVTSFPPGTYPVQFGPISGTITVPAPSKS